VNSIFLSRNLKSVKIGFYRFFIFRLHGYKIQYPNFVAESATQFTNNYINEGYNIDFYKKQRITDIYYIIIARLHNFSDIIKNDYIIIAKTQSIYISMISRIYGLCGYLHNIRYYDDDPSFFFILI